MSCLWLSKRHRAHSNGLRYNFFSVLCTTPTIKYSSSKQGSYFKSSMVPLTALRKPWGWNIDMGLNRDCHRQNNDGLVPDGRVWGGLEVNIIHLNLIGHRVTRDPCNFHWWQNRQSTFLVKTISIFILACVLMLQLFNTNNRLKYTSICDTIQFFFFFRKFLGWW